jgi:hypothetical protein
MQVRLWLLALRDAAARLLRVREREFARCLSIVIASNPGVFLLMQF